MFELGRATAVEATLVLRALSRGGDVPQQLVIALGQDGTLSTITDPAQEYYDIELQRALDEGAAAAVSVTTDVPNAEMSFCCMLPGDVRVYWAFTYRFGDGTIELSKIVELGERWSELRAGLYAGLNDVAAAAGLVVDARPVNELRYSLGLVELADDPIYADCGYAAGGVLADVVARREADALAPEVVGANVEDGEVFVERYASLEAAIAAQRDQRLPGFVILVVATDRLSIRVPAADDPAHMRILWDARYAIVDGRLRASRVALRGDSPAELTRFLDGLTAACDEFLELDDLEGAGCDLELLEGGP